MLEELNGPDVHYAEYNIISVTKILLWLKCSRHKTNLTLLLFVKIYFLIHTVKAIIIMLLYRFLID